MSKISEIDGVVIVNTTDICSMLGVSVSSFFLEEELGIKPKLKTGTAIYWEEKDFPLICSMLCMHIMEKGVDFSWSRRD